MPSYLDPHWHKIERWLAAGWSGPAIAEKLIDMGVNPPFQWTRPHDDPETIRGRAILSHAGSISRQRLVRRAAAADTPRAEPVAVPQPISPTGRRFDKWLRTRRVQHPPGRWP